MSKKQPKDAGNPKKPPNLSLSNPGRQFYCIDVVSSQEAL